MLMAKKNISVSVKIKDIERLKINLLNTAEVKKSYLSIYIELKINLTVLNSVVLKSSKSLVIKMSIYFNFIAKNPHGSKNIFKLLYRNMV